MESQIIPMKFLNSLLLLFIGLCCTLNIFFSMNDLLTSYVGHWENIGSLSYASLPDVDTFYYTILKSTYIDITINFIRKVKVLGNYQAHSGEYKFSKI